MLRDLHALLLQMIESPVPPLGGAGGVRSP